ncbi:MAG: CYTH domain-containing protein [Spirochaetales bacterium]|nr:CYTH domain-containing protein [Spirochaetales bacterium]
MGKEIERKYLIKGEGWRDAEAVYYCQGYLARKPDATVRVRVAGNEGFLTIKGAPLGMSRDEWEYSIPVGEAEEMMNLCRTPLIIKNRRKIESGGFLWEVDEFLGDNEGLILAEIELKSEEQVFSVPEWIGEEVTGDARYYNSNLSENPYKNW